MILFISAKSPFTIIFCFNHLYLLYGMYHNLFIIYFSISSFFLNLIYHKGRNHVHFFPFLSLYLQFLEEYQAFKSAQKILDELIIWLNGLFISSWILGIYHLTD